MLNVSVISSGQRFSEHTVKHIQGALQLAHGTIADTSLGLQEVTVLLAGVDEISTLHETYFDDPSPTDVISFPSDERAEDTTYLGDIAICVEVAAGQAGDAGNSEVREVVFLALHGLLHLLGWTDNDAHQRRSMLKLQDDLLRQYENEQGSL